MVATAAGIMPLKGSISRDLLLEPVDVEARGVLWHFVVARIPHLGLSMHTMSRDTWDSRQAGLT